MHAKVGMAMVALLIALVGLAIGQDVGIRRGRQLERQEAALRARMQAEGPPGPARGSYARLEARVRKLEALLAASGTAFERLRKGHSDD